MIMYHTNFLEEDLRTHESPLGTFLQAGTLKVMTPKQVKEPTHLNRFLSEPNPI